jgi:polyhydroxybutyrate depolymerase
MACTADQEAPAKPPPPTVFGGERPTTLFVPDGYDASKPHPLLVMVHGYMSSGLAEELILRLEGPALARGYLYLRPDGTFDPSGARFWNDWPGGHGGATVDDVGYLSKLIDDVRAAYNVDPARIYVTGHSNGGAMSYRMACDRASVIAAIAVLAGGMPANASSVCKPAAPMHLLNVHGDKDGQVSYEGSDKRLGAKACVDFWSAHAKCSGSEKGQALDLEKNLAGAETEVERRVGCVKGSAELWTIVGGSHVPLFTPSYAEKLLDFFDAHPRVP